MSERYLERLGDGYHATIDHKNHLVYVCALDEPLRRRVRRMLAAQLEAHRRTLFPHPFRRNVVVVLPTAGDYERLAGRAEALGHYNPRERCLVTMTLSSVLLHEFTHAVHHNDQLRSGQKHALWLVEAIATLYQYAEVQDGRLVPQTGAGLMEVQAALRGGGEIPLAALVRMEQPEFTEKAELSYPQVRWLAMYLQRHGKLETFYRAYKDTYRQDATGAAALEKVLARPLAAIHNDWREWVLQQKPAWRPRFEAVAHLGIRMNDHQRGVLVDALLPGSAAQRAGRLKVGDVILTVAGKPTRTPRALTAAVRSCRPGQSVVIEVLRNDRLTRLTQVLGAVRHKGK